MQDYYCAHNVLVYVPIRAMIERGISPGDKREQ